MVPVMSTPPLCTLKELKDGTYDLADIAFMIDALLVKLDNEAIMQEIRDRK
jgi:hypothetical protein